MFLIGQLPGVFDGRDQTISRPVHGFTVTQHEKRLRVARARRKLTSDRPRECIRAPTTELVSNKFPCKFHTILHRFLLTLPSIFSSTEQSSTRSSNWSNSKFFKKFVRLSSILVSTARGIWFISYHFILKKKLKAFSVILVLFGEVCWVNFGCTIL